MEASEQVRAPLAIGPGDEVANLKKLVTELRCHVAFLWEGLEELWKLRREVEDLEKKIDISGTKSDGQSRWSWQMQVR